MTRRLLIVGGSRGIGAAACRHYADRGDTVLAVSRTRAVAGRWIEADVATAEVEADIEEGRFPPQRPIPMADLLAALDFVLSTSPSSTVREIDLAQRHLV